MTFVKYQSANNAQGVLHMPISSSATSLQLKSGQGDRFKDTFPYLLAVEQLDDLLAVIKREIVKVTNKVGDVLTIVRSAGTCLPDDESTTQGTQAFSFDADVTRVMQYIMAEQIEDIQEEVERIVDEELPNKLDVSEYQEGKYVYGASSGGSDSYAITLPNPPTAYEVGQTFRFQADVGNTGSATLNVNGLGAIIIKKLHDQDLETGDIEAGQIVVVAYDGTNFQMNSQTALIATAPDATTEIKGIIEIATTEEAVAGLSTSLAIAPEGVKKAIKGGDYDVVLPIVTLNDKIKSGITISDYFNRSYIQDNTGDTYVYSQLPIKADGSKNYNAYLTFSDVDTIEAEFDAGFFSNPNDKRRIGFFGDTTTFYNETTVQRHVTVDHKLSNTYVTLDTADGTTQSAGANCAMAGNYYTINRYKLIYKVGVDVKLYVNGTLADTKTTNLPTTGNLLFGLGAIASSNGMTLQNCIVRIKYT